MAITKDAGRQEVITAMVDINFGDVSPSASDQNAIAVPANAVVLSGDVVPITVFNSATSDVLDVGDSGSQNRYLNDGNIAATARIALVPTGFKYTTASHITVRWVGVGAVPTQGKVRLTVVYAVQGRAAFAQG